MSTREAVLSKKGRRASKKDEARDSSNLFKYFRAIGNVASSIASKMHYNNGIPYVTTCVGSSILTFDVSSSPLRRSL